MRTKIFLITILFLLLLTLPAFAETKVLLHFNGADESTTITDSASRHSPSAMNNAQIETADSKFGGACLLLDGDSDYVIIPDSADWDFYGDDTKSWTIDFWIKHAVANGSSDEAYFSQYETAGDVSFNLRTTSEDLMIRYWDDNTMLLNMGGSFQIQNTNWHHYAYCSVAGVIGIYVDGVQVEYGSWGTEVTYVSDFYIGTYYPTSTKDFEGLIDEFRVTDENSFGANPNAGKTDTITVPTAEYELAGSGSASQTNVVVMM